MISIYTYGVGQTESIHVALRAISNAREIHKSVIKIRYDSPSPTLSAFHCLDQAFSFMTSEAQDRPFTIYVPDNLAVFAVNDELDLDLPDFCQKVIKRHKLLKNNFLYSIAYASPQFSPVMRCTKDMLGMPDLRGSQKRSHSYFGKAIGKTKAESYRKRYYNS